MAKLLYSAAMSLDGFIAGVDGDMSWLSAFAGGDRDEPSSAELAQEVGSLLVGRRTHDGDDPNSGTENEGAYGGAWHGPVIVLTHRPPAEPYPDTTFHTDLPAAVTAARAAAGDKYVSILGADVGRQCLEAGLVDEIAVYVVPVLLGDGVPLFRHAGGTDIRLEPTGRTAHWYRVVSR
jgi:dihydrofolate reductase